MSRIAKNPLVIPSGVEIKLDGQLISIKGGNGEFKYTVHKDVEIVEEDGSFKFSSKAGKQGLAMAGTMRAVIGNLVTGVTDGFEKRLTIIGVGYRAKASGNKVDLSLGFSHPVIYEVPKGITVETPSNTEIVIKGADKQLVGQVAANIRAFRPPEPYKGKGVRYSDEYVIRKEAKKK